jgi:hypothetical protein
MSDKVNKMRGMRDKVNLTAAMRDKVHLPDMRIRFV